MTDKGCTLGEECRPSADRQDRSSAGNFHDSGDDRFWLFPEFALPQPYSRISTAPGEALSLSVARGVLGQLCSPISGVRLWDMAAPWALVPETAVNEDGDP
jgi:hypothetical protein